MWGGEPAHVKGARRELELIAHRDLVIPPHDWLQHSLQPLQSPRLICTAVVCPLSFFHYVYGECCLYQGRGRCCSTNGR